MVDATDVRNMIAENIGEVYVELITFSAQGEPTGYMVLDTQPITSRGNEYQPADVQFNPAKLTGQELSRASIVFSNVTRELVDELRQAHERPTITAELISTARPDTVVQTKGPYEVRSATFTTSAIKIDLSAAQVFDEQFPIYTFNPAQSPGVFA